MTNPSHKPAAAQLAAIDRLADLDADLQNVIDELPTYVIDLLILHHCVGLTLPAAADWTGIPAEFAATLISHGEQAVAECVPRPT